MARRNNSGTLRGVSARLTFGVSLVVLAGALAVGFVSMLNSEVEAEAAAGSIAPVEATYQGVRPYDSISSGTLDYDAWTYRDIVFYSPPGMVTQDMANQWLAWYATTDDILRALIDDDEHFESRFRRNDRNFGSVKVIGTPPDSCGAGCGNKQIAEGVGIIDNMVAEPDNYEHHWILFYEQARGGVDETFDLAASWPREAYHLPHLIAALTYYEIDGLEGLQTGVPGDIYGGLQKWADLDRQYVDVFVEREQRWFGDQYPDGSYIYPPQTSMLLHMAVDNGYGTVAQILRNVGQYPDNFMYDNSTDALCDWQAAVNDATGNRYADQMVNEWGFPGNCTTGLGQAESAGHHPSDLRFEASGLCADPNYKPGSGMVGQYPCDGSTDQQFGTTNDRGDGTFSVTLGSADRCLDASGTRVVTWSCHGAANQIWQWNGTQLQQPVSGLCISAPQNNRWGGGVLEMAPCADSSTQRINTNGPVLEVPARTPEAPTTTTAPPPPVTEAPTTTTEAPTTTTEAPAPAPTAAPEPTVAPKPTAAPEPTVAPEPPVTEPPRQTPPPTEAPTTTAPPTTPPPTTAPEQTLPPTKPTLPEGEFWLVNAGSGKCVDQPSSQEDLGVVIQWTCHSGTNQRFQAVQGRDGFMLVFSHSGKCADMWLGDLYQYTCNGGDNQLFNWDGAQLRLKDSGECVTVEGDSLENRANVRLAPCADRPAQQFRVERFGVALQYW